MEFIAECVLADIDTEIHLTHDIKQVGGINAYIDIYYWKFCHFKINQEMYNLDTNRPYYTLCADVRFRNVFDCVCYGYARKSVMIQSEWRDGCPTIESVKSLLDEFMDKLKTIQFDKLSGSFNKQDMSNAEECCVCLEPTVTKTNCRHHICIPCWNQIASQKCPLCRRDIHLYCKYE